MQYFLFLATSFGFVDEAYEAAKDGIVEAVSMAHDNMQRANVYWHEGELYDASINRSPTSYLLNPASVSSSHHKCTRSNSSV